MSITRNLYLPLSVCLAFFNITVLAQDTPANPEDEQLLQELMQVVEQGTEIATRTKMNVDYVPGMATVLEGEMLEALGARTVLDAMAMVPGVLTFLTNSGQSTLLVRGIAFPFNTGNIKVLVNGLSMSGESTGISNSLLLMPLAQVERLEFVRGPGSTLYGDFAFMGLLNIVTRQNDRQTFVRIQEGPSFTAGGNARWESQDKASKVWLNASALRTDDAVRPDGQASDDRQEFAMLGIEQGGLKIGAQTMRRRLTPEDPANRTRNQRNDVFNLRYAGALAPNLAAEIQSGWLDTKIIDNSRYQGDILDGALQLRWTGWAGHMPIARMSAARERIEEAQQTRPVPPGAPPSPPVPPVTDKSRDYWGLSLQDQWTLSDALSLTTGLRYDRREDLDKDRLTPRVGLVWRAAEKHILKAQYAEGYRAPTFFELFAADGSRRNLDLETIGTSELSYIYRAPQTVGRVTLFHSELRDMVFVASGGTFDSRTRGGADGIEAEWQQQLSAQWQWQANLSYVDAFTTRTPDDSEGEDAVAADWLGNLAVLYRPGTHWLLATHYTYVGERNAVAANPDPPGEEHRLTLAVSMVDLPFKGLNLRVFARNVLERDEYTVTANPAGVSVSGLDDAILGAQVSYEF